jgi:hypothetical protein
MASASSVLALAMGCSAEPVDIRPLDSMPRYVVFRRSEAIEVGGGLADPGWARVDSLDLRVGSERLAVRFACDSELLYVALWSSKTVSSCALAIDADNDGTPSLVQPGIQLEKSEPGWQREIAIPFAMMGDLNHRPPHAGDRITVTISGDVSVEPVASVRLEFADRAPP